MSPAAQERDEHAAAIGRLGAALLAGRAVVPGIDRTTEARVRAVIERLLTARAELPVDEGDE